MAEEGGGGAEEVEGEREGARGGGSCFGRSGFAVCGGFLEGDGFLEGEEGGCGLEVALVGALMTSLSALLPIISISGSRNKGLNTSSARK